MIKILNIKMLLYQASYLWYNPWIFLTQNTNKLSSQSTFLRIPIFWEFEVKAESRKVRPYLHF